MVVTGLYSIVNPSDPYWIEGPFEACAAAVLIMGNGHITLEDAQKKSLMPLFLFSSEDEIDAFWKKSFGRRFKDYISSPDAVPQIRDALLTVEIGSIAEHDAYLSSLSLVSADKHEAWKLERQRLQQTSTRDLRTRAHETAKLITKEKTP